MHPAPHQDGSITGYGSGILDPLGALQAPLPIAGSLAPRTHAVPAPPEVLPRLLEREICYRALLARVGAAIDRVDDPLEFVRENASDPARLLPLRELRGAPTLEDLAAEDDGFTQLDAWRRGAERRWLER